MYLCDQVQILGSPWAPFILSLMYDRYTKLPSWWNLAKRPTLQRGSRDAAECADAGCTGATGTRGYGGCAGAAVLGCGRSVPLKTAVKPSPWTERGAPKSALTHPKQTPFSSLEIFFKRRVAACPFSHERHAGNGEVWSARGEGTKIGCYTHGAREGCAEMARNHPHARKPAQNRPSHFSAREAG